MEAMERLWQVQLKQALAHKAVRWMVWGEMGAAEHMWQVQLEQVLAHKAAGQMAWGEIKWAEEKQCLHEWEEQWQRGAKHDQMVLGSIPRVLCHKHQSGIFAYKWMYLDQVVVWLI
jgi:hypothetical protein